MKVKSKKITSQIENYIEKHEKLCVVFLMLFSAVFLSGTFLNSYPMHTTTDELGTIVGAATWAGYDWGGVIGRSGYYGFGYYALFAPLFAMKLSPVVIYRIVLVTTRVLRGCIISGTAYYIGSHYFKFPSKFMLMQVAFICTIPLYSDLDGTIVNDIVLETVLWIIILLLCKMIEYMEKPGKCMFIGAGYVLVSAYATLLHTRAIIIIIASFLTVMVLFSVKKRKCLLIATLVVPVSYVMQPLIKAYQNAIWLSAGSELRNAAVSVSTDFSIINPDTWAIWFDIVVGNIAVQTLLTGGLFLAAVVVVLKYLYGAITRKVEGENIYVNAVLSMTILCIGAVFAAFFVSDWFMGMYDTWGTSEAGTIYSYKGICYVRYWNIFAMPFMFAGCYLMHKLEVSTWIKAFLGWIGVVIGAFIVWIVPLIQTNSSAGTFLFKFLGDVNEKVNRAFYYKCILICIVVVLISSIIYYYKKNVAWAIIPILLMMAVGYNSANEYYNEDVNKRASAMVMSSYKQKDLLEEANIHIDRVYAVDNRDTDQNWYIFSILQFYFYEHRIEEGLPMEMGAYDVIIARKQDMAIAAKYPELNCYVLDDNEVWYTELDLIGVDPE